MNMVYFFFFFFFSSRRRHTRYIGDWSSDVCSSDLGDTLKNPDLAWTLEQIAAGGADAFYKGEIARRLVADLHAKGNAMKLTDLARYYAAERQPVESSYRGYTLFSSAPPVSGGSELAAQLNLLE